MLSFSAGGIVKKAQLSRSYNSLTFIQSEGDDYPILWKTPRTNSMVDSWGMGNRECTSWASLKVWEKYNYSTYGFGDAREWVHSAMARNVPFGDTPRINSVAVDTSFSPGHVMWVENINKDGTLNVSEYNHTPGEYSERTISHDGLQFIYFNEVTIK
jgi:surface antigen